jgi:hypothetical protein
VNGDSKRTIESIPFLVGSLGLRDFFSALAAIVGPVQNTFPHIYNFNFTFFVLITQQASWAGNRAGAPVSLCVSLLATP